jgi:ribosome recycling factor
MDPIVSGFKQNAQNTINSLREELKTIRTGRATPALIENMMIETYGGQAKLRLMELAGITTEGPSAISVTPFDPSTITDIERAILKSPLGISPVVQGGRIIVRIPPLSEEQRQKMVKLINQITEEKKGVIRNHRDEARKKIKNQFEAKEITEDNKFRLEKEIDNINQKITEEVQSVRESKEREVMEV